jgi:hypothetical protein
MAKKSPAQLNREIAAALSSKKLIWKKEPGMPGIQAPISHGGAAHDYVISHRTDDHTVAYRPPGAHHHVGSYKTEAEAKAAAAQHAKTGKAPASTR